MNRKSKKNKNQNRRGERFGQRGGDLSRIARIESRSGAGDSAGMDSPVFKNPRGYPKLTPRITRPMPGAQMTLSQIVPGSSFTTATGLTGDLIVANQSSDTAVVLNFALANLGQVATLTALYEQYRFERIRVFFVSTVSEVPYASTATAPPAVPPLITVVDYDDATALASAAAAYQYDNIALCAPYQSLEVELIPKFVPWNNVSGGATTGGGTMASIDEWLSSAVNNVIMYGVKAYLTADGSATGHQSWRVYAEYVISFKNVK